MTQPAVSIQLKNFQDQFDIPLTEVLGRRIYITDFGLEIANAAEKIIHQVYAINYKTEAYKGKLSGRLKISVVSTGKYVMPYFLSDFINQNKSVELTMDVTNKTRVIESLKNNEVDFALVSVLPKGLNIEKLDLLQNKLYLIGPGNTQIKKELNVKKRFKDLPLIFREKGSGTRQTMEKFITDNEVSVLKKMELTSNEAVKQSIMAGLGFSILPIIGIKNELQNKSLEIIPVKGLPIRTTWSIIWLKGKNHSPASLAFLKYLESEKVNIINDKFSWGTQY